MQHRGNARSWPALDGLRGLAVVAVVAYHLDESLFPGGFLGVSLFFSMSGFLIIGKLAEEHGRTGTIELRRFWTRRIRRLAPAFSVTVLATVLFVAMKEPDAIDRVVGDGLAGIGYVANWRDVLAEVAYAERFAAGVDPLGHLWSLSIEEQVYVIAPITVGLWGIRRVGWLAGLVVIGGVALWWGDTDAYFATPVRVAEVVAGGMLGVKIFSGVPPPVWLTRAAVPAAVAALATVFVVSDVDALLFTGGLPLMAVLWVPMLAGAVDGGRFARTLSVAPLRWAGDRSYAIYLFHVPIIELTDFSALEVVITTLAAAEVSARLVEIPVRRGAATVPILLAGGAAVAVFAVAVAVVPQAEDDVFVMTQAELGDSLAAPAVDSPTSPVASAAEPPLTANEPPPAADAPPVVMEPLALGLRVATVGDSTMYVLEPALRALLTIREGELLPRSVPACSPLFTEEEDWNVRFNTGPDGFIAAGYCRQSLGEILAAASPVDVVVILDHGMALIEHQPVGRDAWMSIEDDEMAAALWKRYERWIAEAAEADVGVVLATVTPGAPDSPGARSLGDDPEARVQAYNDIVQRLAERYPFTVVLVDLAAAVSGDAERYPRDDGVHFTDLATVAVVIDHLGPAIQQASSFD